MTTLPFIKMHGLGNDFVVLDARKAAIGLTPPLVRAIGDRRRGVGFDQLLTLQPSERADCFMRIDNSDGSSANACGNGARCVARLLMAESGKNTVLIDSKGGLLQAESAEDGLVAVKFGAPDWDWRAAPLAREMDTLHLDLSVSAGGVTLKDPAVLSMGNPHAVFFVDDAEAPPLEQLGPLVERHELFPERVTCSLVSRWSDGALRLRVFERGAGVTRACGSAACAAYAAAIARKLVDGPLRINLDGGPLFMRHDDDGGIWMTGPAAHVYRGEIAAELLQGAGS